MRIKFVFPPFLFFFIISCCFPNPVFAQIQVKDGGQVAIGTDDPENAKVKIVTDSVAQGTAIKIENQHTGTGNAYGINSSITQFSNDHVYGYKLDVDNQGTARTYGLRIDVDSSGTNLKTGIESIVYENVNSTKATKSIFGESYLYGPSNSYGVMSTSYVNSGSQGKKYGLLTQVTPETAGQYGSGKRYALYAKIGSTATDHYAGYFEGNVYVTGTVTENGSDIRLKRNIQDLQGALAIVQQLQPKKYKFKNNIQDVPLPEGYQFGLIAQEVESVLPEIVGTVQPPFTEEEGNGGGGGSNPGMERIEEYKTLDYQSLIPILIGAIKEQQQLIEELQARVERLENN